MKHSILKKFIHPKDRSYAFFAAITGTAAHFLYDLSGNNPIVGLFTPVNESTWEHMKLLFFPMLLFSCFQFYFQEPEKVSFWSGRLFGTWSSILLTILFCYGYSGAIGKDIGIINILSYYLGIVLAFRISRKAFRYFKEGDPMILFLFWSFSAILFFLFTCFPPELPLFLSPV